MSLLQVIERRKNKRRAMRKEALKETKRLVLLLRERFDFQEIFIYGSVLTDKFSRISDIDMAIKGLKTEDFFKAYALLIKASSFSIDLKPFEDMTEDFKQMVIKKGVKVE